MVIDADIRNVRMGDLKHGDETPWYEVVGKPQRRADGSVMVPVRHFADPWGTHFVRGAVDDLVPIVASEQLTITHHALPLNGACPHCGSTETDGSPCPWSLVCPLCMALPWDPCRRPSGHLEQVMHGERIRAAEGRP